MMLSSLVLVVQGCLLLSHSAKDAGASVVLLEKMPVIGGNTAKSSAGMNASQTKFQEAEGIADTKDKCYEETLKGRKGTNDPE